MRFEELVTAIRARVIVPARADDLVIRQIYAGDRMSDLLNGVAADGMIITHIAHQSLIRLIELMDVPALCLLNGVEPEDRVIEVAREHGAALIVMPQEMYESCGVIYQALMRD